MSDQKVKIKIKMETERLTSKMWLTRAAMREGLVPVG